MKSTSHFRLLVVTGFLLVMCGCFTTPAPHSQASQRLEDGVPPEIQALLNDRSHWVEGPLF